MNVSVRLFAMLRERAGRDVVELELPEGARVADALAALDDVTSGIPCVMAVNRDYAAEQTLLAAGDELALIPPVSGGAPDPSRPTAGLAHVAILAEPLSLDALVARVGDSRAGAIVTFSGVTREVDLLEYEAYQEMALESMRGIVAEAIATHGLCAAAAEHRVGAVPLGEPSVIVAASAPHRPEAFLGAREMIDRMKASTPIWKVEVAGGERHWVEGTTPEAGA